MNAGKWGFPGMCAYCCLCEIICVSRIRSEEDALGASSRSPSLTFPTRASLPQPETPHAAAVTPLSFTNGACCALSPLPAVHATSVRQGQRLELHEINR